MSPAFDALLNEFYAAHPEHIVGIHTEATVVATGEHKFGHHLDSESLRAFFVWLVRTGRKPRAVVERAYTVYHTGAPDDFPMPYPWSE